jgi:hypothetical protein
MSRECVEKAEATGKRRPKLRLSNIVADPPLTDFVRNAYRHAGVAW